MEAEQITEGQMYRSELCGAVFDVVSITGGMVYYVKYVSPRTPVEYGNQPLMRFARAMSEPLFKEGDEHAVIK